MSKITNGAHSPLRYPGGKGKITKFVNNVLFENNINGTYIEPFAGGAGVAINLLLANKVDNIIINDLDDGVFSFWQTVVESPQYLIQKISKVPFNYNDDSLDPEKLSKYWMEIKNRYKRNIYFNRKQKAFDFFMLNRMNHSGVLHAGPIGGIKQTGKYNISSRFNKEALIKKIEQISNKSNKITVTNLEASYFIEKYVYRIVRDIDNSFMFVDPPYFVQGKNLYSSFATDRIHQLVADNLQSPNNKIKWILTYDRTNPIDKLYSEANISKFEYSLRYNANKRGNFTEFLFTNNNTVVNSFDNVQLLPIKGA